MVVLVSDRILPPASVMFWVMFSSVNSSKNSRI